PGAPMPSIPERVLPQQSRRPARRTGSMLARISRRLVTVAVLLPALLLAPIDRAATAQDDDPLDVVVSFSVLADIVEQVGGDRVSVTSLVPVGGDAHTFDPSPDQIAAIADADLIVEAG